MVTNSNRERRLRGNLVIAFDEYEVAPGYMGAQEFTVEKGIFENLLK